MGRGINMHECNFFIIWTQLFASLSKQILTCIICCCLNHLRFIIILCFFILAKISLTHFFSSLLFSSLLFSSLLFSSPLLNPAINHLSSTTCIQFSQWGLEWKSRDCLIREMKKKDYWYCTCIIREHLLCVRQSCNL